MPKVVCYDSETNGLLEPKPGEKRMDRIHCLGIIEPGGPAVLRFHDHPDLCARDGSIRDGLDLLAAADERWGHNAIGFDERALRLCYPDWNPRGVVRDTLIIGRTVWPDEHLKHMDMTAVKRKRSFPKNLIGRHSLEAWGYRLKDCKGEKPESWAHFTPEMMLYNVQDVVVLELLRRRILAHEPTEAQILLEQAFAPIVQAQINRGFRLNQDRVHELVRDLTGRRAELDVEIRKAFPDFADHYVTPKKQIKKTRTVVFNPNSRLHIARALGELHGWKPTEFTPSGDPKVDEAVIGALIYPEAKLIAQRLKIQKTLGTVAEGDGAWLKLVKPDGRVHGYMAHNAAVTSRCTHSRPNLGNVDTRPELRRCWVASPGHKLVIADASGLEARVIGHFAARFDGGELGRLLLEGDVHKRNQELIKELLGWEPARVDAKRVFYGILYGAQDAKVGLILGKSAAIGKRVRDAILKGLPGLGKLIAAVQADAMSRGWLRGLDGRRLWVRSKHAALNTLVQGGGAILMKQAIVDCPPAADYMVAFVHDELVLDVPACLAPVCALSLEAAVVSAGAKYKLRVPLAAHVVVGDDWSVK